MAQKSNSRVALVQYRHALIIQTKTKQGKPLLCLFTPFLHPLLHLAPSAPSSFWFLKAERCALILRSTFLVLFQRNVSIFEFLNALSKNELTEQRFSASASTTSARSCPVPSNRRAGKRFLLSTRRQMTCRQIFQTVQDILKYGVGYSSTKSITASRISISDFYFGASQKRHPLKRLHASAVSNTAHLIRQ